MSNTARGWVLPDVGESGWGTKLNTAINAIDTDVTSVATTASAALPKAGGVMTGRLDGKTLTMPSVSVAPVVVGGTSTATFDLASAQFFTTTVNGATTFVFSNLDAAASGLAQGFMIAITATSASVITFPSGVRWAEGIVPEWTVGAGKCDIVAFITISQGTQIFASVIGQNYSLA
jgi:hypothetical protein